MVRTVPSSFLLGALLLGCGTGGGDPVADLAPDAAESDAPARGDGGDGAAPEPGDGGDVEDAAGPDQDGTDAGSDAGPDAGPEEPWPWRAEVQAETPYLRAEGLGCLAPTGDVAAPGLEVDVLADDGRFLLVGEDGTCLAKADTAPVAVPEPLPAVATLAEVALASTRHVFDAAGCPVPDTAEGAELPLFAEVAAVASWHDASHRGFVVLDRALRLGSYRTIDVDGAVYPWSASLLVVKEIPGEGFLIGGGVLVGPNAFLTAAHLGVDETFCYSWGPAAGPAWDEGGFECSNIAGPAEAHPDGVDLAIAHLVLPEPPPYAPVRAAPAAPGEPFFTSRLGELNTHVFSDGVVLSVGNENAWCHDWPPSSSFLSAPIAAQGDSGGPAWIGSDLVGLVHGEKCLPPLAPGPADHVFVHLPGVFDFLEPVLPVE